MILAIPILLLLAVSIVYGHRRDAVEDGAIEPSMAGHDARTADPARRAAVLALARTEARLLLRHPAFIPFFALNVLAVTLVAIGDPAATAPDTAILLGLAIWPVAGGTLIATNLAMRRGRRDGAEQIHALTTMPPSSRATAHLLATAAAVLVAALVCAWAIVTVVIRDGSTFRPIELATPLLLVAGAGAIGVVTARFIRWNLGWAIGMGAVLIVQVGAWAIKPETNRLRWLGPWVGRDQFIPADLALDREPGWHAMYLAGLVGLLVVIAAARRSAGRRLIAAATIAGALAATGAFAQTRPLTPEEGARIAAVVAHRPETCRTADRLLVCARTARALDGWLPPLSGVLARVPADARPGTLEVWARPSSLTLRALAPEIRAALPAWIPAREPFVWPDDGRLGIDLRTGEMANDAQLNLRFALGAALWAVGLPLEPGSVLMTERHVTEMHRHPVRASADPSLTVGRPAMVRCVAAHQARAVVALWLAGQATPLARAALTGPAAPGDAFDDDGITVPAGMTAIPHDTDALLFIEPGSLWAHDAPSPALWALSDLRYAEQLLEQPAEEVAAAVAASWNHFTDPATPTSALVGALGLEPLAEPLRTLPSEPIEPRCSIPRA